MVGKLETVIIRTDSLLKGHILPVSNDVSENSTSESNSNNSRFEEISQAELNKGNLDTILTEHIPLNTVSLEDSQLVLHLYKTKKCILLQWERAKYLYSRNPVLSICAFPQFSVDKNDHQIVN